MSPELCNLRYLPNSSGEDQSVQVAIANLSVDFSIRNYWDIVKEFTIIYTFTGYKYFRFMFLVSFIHLLVRNISDLCSWYHLYTYWLETFQIYVPGIIYTLTG